MTRKRFIGSYVAFGVIVFLLQVFPLYELGNRAEPIVLGMPFSMFWIVFWIAVQFVVLLAFYAVSNTIDD